MNVSYPLRPVMGVFLAVIVAGCSGGSNPNPATVPAATATPVRTIAAQTWHVLAGSQDSTEAFQAFPFYPSALTVNAGDTVTWSFPAGEPHTVSFPLPGTSPVSPTDPTAPMPLGGTTYDGSTYVSSGFLLGGATYSLTFTKPGTYTYVSLPQAPLATGTIVVQAANTALPVAQSAIDAAAQIAIAADLAAAQNSVAFFPYTPNGPHLTAGIAPGLANGKPANGTVMRFVAAPNDMSGAVTVSVGTTVVWTNQANDVPHNIYFPPLGQQPPAGPPFIAGSSATTYDGTAVANSAVLGPGQSYSLTFTKAGTFKYFCLFHDDEGMTGTVTVK
jgi:plastocyanin